MSSKPPRFTTAPPKPCDECPIHMWAALSNPEAVNVERWARRDERRILAALVKKSMTTENIRQLSLANQKLLVELAQVLLQAIADQEAAA